MDFKRNIFQSSARMPDRNETVSSAMFDKNDEGYRGPFQGKQDLSVKHAPCPRIGEQK